MGTQTKQNRVSFTYDTKDKEHVQLSKIMVTMSNKVNDISCDHITFILVLVLITHLIIYIFVCCSLKQAVSE